MSLRAMCDRLAGSLSVARWLSFALVAVRAGLKITTRRVTADPGYRRVGRVSRVGAHWAHFAFHGRRLAGSLADAQLATQGTGPRGVFQQPEQLSVKALH